MSGTGPQPKQLSLRDAYESFMQSAPKMVVGAAVCMLLATLLPVVGLSTNIMGVAGSQSFSGSETVGAVAWLAFLVFATAAAARFVPALYPYSKLIDMAAFAMVGIALIWAFVGGPVASGVHQANEVQSQFGGLLGGAPPRGGGPPASLATFSMYPHVGLIFFVLAPVLLLLARRREPA